MSGETPSDPDLLGTDVNWQTAHDSGATATEQASGEDRIEAVKSNPQFLALDEAAKEDVLHMLDQILLRDVMHTVAALTPEADAVVADVVGVGKGYLGARETSQGRFSYATTEIPRVARVTIENVNSGAEKYGYAVIPAEGRKPWEPAEQR